MEKFKKWFVVLLMLASSVCVVAGINVAYANTKSMGFGDDTGAFNSYENEDGDTMVKIYDSIFNLTEKTELIREKTKEYTQKLSDEFSNLINKAAEHLGKKVEAKIED